MVKYTGRGLVVERPGVLSEVQVLNLVLGVGVFSFFQIGQHFGRTFLGIFVLHLHPKTPPTSLSTQKTYIHQKFGGRIYFQRYYL